MAITREVGQDEVAARYHPAGESSNDAPRVAIVRYAMQDRNEQGGDRLGEVDQPTHIGIGEDLPGVPDIALDHRSGGVVDGQQCLGVGHHDGVVIDIDNVRVRASLLGDLVHVALTGQAGPEVEKLADALARGKTHGPVEEPPVSSGYVTVLRGHLEQLFHRVTVGGEVVLPAQLTARRLTIQAAFML